MRTIYLEFKHIQFKVITTVKINKLQYTSGRYIEIIGNNFQQADNYQLTFIFNIISQYWCSLKKLQLKN